ncbi:cytochrome c-type biogenesis protein [Dongia soli]|uniref:Cytochrome c-type biogenesis protein n=1 Tax=Dongia soli TaxID=600628 RepID=A0ABU5E814_9PROT|nr:cytochrome c-type biogenesis protein [Dongia soli]MDY0881874.1 cytochrome c-type biogenesis protein [Dongia soli]
MSGRRILAAFLLLLPLLAAGPAMAVRPDEMLSDPALEARARAISKDIRCVVCQSENIDDSDADIAHDLRVLIREQLAAGKSDQQVRDFLVARYGDFVLLKPPFKMKTLLLWAGPFAMLLIAGGGILLFYRRRRDTVEAPPLSADERAKLDAFMAENENTGSSNSDSEGTAR